MRGVPHPTHRARYLDRVRHPGVTRVLAGVLLLAASVGCSGAGANTAVPAVTVITTTATITSAVTVTKVGPTTTAPGRTILVTTTAETTVTLERTVTGVATVTNIPQAPPTSSASQAQAAANPWSSTITQVSSGPAPGFPVTLSNWKLASSWDTRARAFSGQWTQVPGSDGQRFPSTMNGCDLQRFLVRWRSVGGAQVDVGLADAADAAGQTVTDTAGWMAFDGCEHPQVRFHGDTNGLTDVTISVQRYEPSA